MRHLTLQGEARPFFEVTLYAKVAGFLRDLKVDKGDHVKKNQLLATITAPELDAQYTAAVADARNKRVNAKRLSALAPAGVVSAQELELGQASADVADATQAALNTQRDYRVIRAPFDGVVTARFADPGTLIQTAAVPVPSCRSPRATSCASTCTSISRAPPSCTTATRPPSAWASGPAGRGRASVTRTSGELSPKTRTMLTEVDIPNADRAIIPGSFVDVSLQVKVPPLLEIPAEALVTRADKPSVATVDASQHIHYQQVVVADDDGQVAHLVSGLQPGQRVALDLGGAAEDGAPIQVVETKPADARWQVAS